MATYAVTGMADNEAHVLQMLNQAARNNLGHNLIGVVDPARILKAFAPELCGPRTGSPSTSPGRGRHQQDRHCG